MKCIDGRLKTNLEKIKNTYVNCCQFGDVKQEDEARWGEVRPRAVTWSDLISWCYFVSGGGRLTSLTLSWLTSPRQSRGHWMLRQPAVFDLNCPRPSVHQSQITHLSTSLFISRLWPVFFFNPEFERDDRWVSGSRSIFPICHQGPVIITTRGLRLRSDKLGQISTDGPEGFY